MGILASISMSDVAVASLRRPASDPFVPTTPHADPFAAWAARSVTIVRIPIAIGGLVAVAGGQPWMAVALFTVFAAIDLLDGIAARRVGVDTAARRAGDVLLDRVAIHAAALTACLVHETGYVVWLLLLSRDVVQGFLSSRFVRRTSVLVIGSHWHMSYGISMLIWGCMFIVNGSPSAIATALAGTVSVTTFMDYYRRCERLAHSLQPTA